VNLLTMPGTALGTEASCRVLWRVYTRGPVTLGAVDEERLAAQLDQDPKFSLLGGTVRRAEGEHIVASGVRGRTCPRAAPVGAALEPWRTRSGFALKYAVAQGPGVAHTVDTVVAAVVLSPSTASGFLGLGSLGRILPSVPSPTRILSRLTLVLVLVALVVFAPQLKAIFSRRRAGAAP